jgi:hypothetical protein
MEETIIFVVLVAITMFVNCMINSNVQTGDNFDGMPSLDRIRF